MRTWKAPSLVFLQLAILLCAALHVKAAPDLHSCPPCDPAVCPKPRDLDCPGNTVRDGCGCCEICAKTIGERCGGTRDVEGVCDERLLCIPDDPYSLMQVGTCQEITPCLTFGCDAVNEQCRCRYSSECPARQFAYATLGECEESLQRSGSECDETQCPQPEECPEGMVYEPGFVLPGDCCPTGGMCVCDYTQCSDEDFSGGCPLGTERTIVISANETLGQCCDVIECWPVPSSCVYEDRVLDEGDRLQIDSCTVCECSFGNLNCLQESCPPLECESGRTFTPEDQCCPICFPMNEISPSPFTPDTPIPGPLFTTCVASNGEVYSNGDSWQDTPCRRCTCDAGEIWCSSVQCLVDCENPVFIPDVCCPVCPEDPLPLSSSSTPSIATSTTSTSSATTSTIPTNPPPIIVTLFATCVASNGEVYSNGDSWQDTPCRRCDCEAGEIYCSTVQCAEVNCENPIVSPDVCCPVCPEDPLPLSSSSTPSIATSTTSTSSATTSTIPTNPPPIIVTLFATCVASNGEVYSNGDSWQDTPCRRCTCEAGEIACSTVQCAVVNCENPIVSPDVCCPVCPEDPLPLSSSSTPSIATSTTSTSSATTSTIPTNPPPIIVTLFATCVASNGEVYSNGDSWQDTPCRRCTCEAGEIACSTVQCAVVNCENPIVSPDVCCPVCPEDPLPLSSSSTPSIATSTSSAATSTIHTNPPPIVVTLFATCVASNGEVYSNGDSWQDTPCRRCTCEAGEIHCSTVQCAAVNCENPIVSPDVCCPVCPEDPLPLSSSSTPSIATSTTSTSSAATSTIPTNPPPIVVTLFATCIASNGEVYSNGDSWQDTPCRRCTCEAGEIHCSTVQCAVVNCENPIVSPDVCCPVCPDDVEDQLPSPSSSIPSIAPTSTSTTSTTSTTTTTQVPSMTIPTNSPDSSLSPPAFTLMEIVVIFDIPFEQYQAEEEQLLTELRGLLSAEGLEVTATQASPYGAMQTHVIMQVTTVHDVSETIAVVSECARDMTAVVRVGTPSEIPSAANVEQSNSDTDSRGSLKSPVIVAVVSSLSLVAVISVIGIIAAVIVITRKRRKPNSKPVDA